VWTWTLMWCLIPVGVPRVRAAQRVVFNPRGRPLDNPRRSLTT
jgi:hypothetical protein